MLEVNHVKIYTVYMLIANQIYAHLESVTGYAEYIALEYVAQLAWTVS